MVDIKYKKNFLTRIIARIDFASPIEGINKKPPKRFDSEALKLFPIKEPPIKAVEGILRFSKNGSEVKDERITKIWVFHDENRRKKLELDLSHFALDVNKYSTYEELKKLFSKLATILIDEFDEIVIKRFGLRYINNINLNEAKPLKWDKYINKELLSIFKIPQETDAILRAFQILILKYNGINLRFRYGMSNPDFPAEIKKKIFVLDFDAYYEGLIEIKDIPNYMDKFHTKIQTLFESVITDELRKKMGKK